ncbi:dCTP deaminase [Candidatus Micrarchaeota archaeon]|nr:dCTP deaminase [Candidatus Micrarchaeota archaeon]
MILSKKKVLQLVKQKKIVITPFIEENLNAASIDLTLSNEFKKIKKKNKVKISEKSFNDSSLFKLIKLKEKELLELKPGELVLGRTIEKISLPDSICGWIQGRSRFARLGLIVHVSSSFIQPGVNNIQVLEIVNLSKNTLLLKPGEKICQVIFEQATGGSIEKGVFSKQTNV